MIEQKHENFVRVVHFAFSRIRGSHRELTSLGGNRGTRRGKGQRQKQRYRQHVVHSAVLRRPARDKSCPAALRNWFWYFMHEICAACLNSTSSSCHGSIATRSLDVFSHLI